MGKYTFKWDQPAEEVYVTGTFDNWTKSIKLDREGSAFQKTVDLGDVTSKIYYKFVVDNDWVLNESAPKEPDLEGNINNFLTPEQLVSPAPEAAVINTITPHSTTAAMAAEQPIEKKPAEEAPVTGATLDSPLNEPAAVPSEIETEPKATPSDIPGGFPVTPANELDKVLSVNPLPATEGAGNPVTLAPGETVPESITAQSTTDNVKLDKESYEKSDALPGIPDLPPVLNTTIPESSLPIVDAKDITISSVTPDATTAALAGEVPKESKVPEVVKESQEKADVAPGASALPEEVYEKAQVEEELKDTVPKAAVTSEGTAGVGTEKTEDSQGLAAIAATTGGAVIAAALSAKDTVQESAAPVVNSAANAATEAANNNLPDSVKEKLPVAAQETLASHNKEEVREEVSPEVPVEVKESITEAGKSPEAAASTSAVEDKKAVEAELLREVEPAPAVSDAKAEGGAVAEGESKAKSKVEEVKSALKSDEPKSEPATENAAESAPKIETTPAEPAQTETTASAAGAQNGTTSAEANSIKSPSSTEKKKKNRLSAMFSKIKSKISDKK